MELCRERCFRLADATVSFRIKSDGMSEAIRTLRIRSLSDALRGLPKQYHWVFADQALIQSIARSERLVRGVMGRRLTSRLTSSCPRRFIPPTQDRESTLNLNTAGRRQPSHVDSATS